jgi:hypothetical protein
LCERRFEATDEALLQLDVALVCVPTLDAASRPGAVRGAARVLRALRLRPVRWSC